LNTQADYQTDLLFDMEYMVLAAEAALFACGELLAFDKLAEAIGAPLEKIPIVLSCLQDRYQKSKTAIHVLIVEGFAQLATKKEYAEIVRTALQLRKNQPLSRAALEVLAITAYHQPVTKAFVDKVRGVESPSVVQSLCEKGLMEEKGRLDAPGRPVLYGTTPIFLRTFGLTSIVELPEIAELQELLTEKQEQTQSEDNSDLGKITDEAEVEA